MKLELLEIKWSDYLGSESCPPVLGLAPLSEEDSEVIRRIVAGVVGRYPHEPPWRVLFALLEKFPSSISIWLARKAGEAYEAGAFWEKFGELINAPIPLNRREQLAERFDVACRRKMATWIPAKELGGHNIVAVFLHQAGLPLDRCESFAQHVRKVERSLGLPDAEDPEAGEQLREAVLESLVPIYVPTLKRALRGPAGAQICEVALNVVLTGNFKGINPKLGKQLEHVFAEATPDTLRRSAQQPFLRLGEDLCSLEIVGPRQDSALVGERGLTWIVDGHRYPTPRTEEFVLRVTERPRVVLELAGLRHGNMPPRTFALQLSDLAEPLMLFDERTRKQRRLTSSIPSGNYWLLHRATDRLVGAEQTYEWPEDERAISLVNIRPGSDAKLETESKVWPLAASLTPFFDPVDKNFTHEGREPVYFNCTQLPFVWLPVEEGDAEHITHWRVHARCGYVEHSYGVKATDERSGGMMKCRVESREFLRALAPGMRRLELTLRRGEQGRAEARTQYWMWQGLRSHDARGFQLYETPSNLLSEECRGFACDALAIRHRTDQNRRHTLVFNIEGEHTSFHWPQPGVFLESLERGAGEQAKPRAHLLEEAFSAALNSSRWLRVWLAGQTGWEISIAGQLWQRAATGDVRDFVELSLASLALAFPQGGEVTLRVGHTEWLVARFSSPLQPVQITSAGDDTHAGFVFEFAEKPSWARAVVWELASGRRWELDGLRVDDLDNKASMQFGLPPIECSRDVQAAQAVETHTLALRVPKRNWPVGFWLVELETRRDERSEWERAVLRGTDHAPVVLSKRPLSPVGASQGEEVDNDYDDVDVTDSRIRENRTRLFWSSLSPRASWSAFGTLDDEARRDLFELLSELIELRQRGVVADARKEMGWLKEAVRSLSRLSGRVARQPEGRGLQIELLNLACQDPKHAGFIYLPGLLALPASDYIYLPTGDPLNDALRRCARVAMADSVAELVRSDFAFFDMSVLGCFANFLQVVSTREGELTPEFQQFDHQKYWNSILGRVRSNQLAADWSGENALGKAHQVLALEELVRRYETYAQELHLGAANALLRSERGFRTWLQGRLATRRVMTYTAWREPWPRFEAPEDFLTSAPKFASLFALAARAAAAGWLDFDDVMKWLDSKVENRWMAEEGIAVLVRLAPELFGHQLLFWELSIRTTPH